MQNKLLKLDTSRLLGYRLFDNTGMAKGKTTSQRIAAKVGNGGKLPPP